MPDKTKLRTLMTDLSQGKDLQLAHAFRTDPVGTMDKHGISKDLQKVVMSGDSKALSGALKNPGIAAADTEIVLVIVI